MDSIKNKIIVGLVIGIAGAATSTFFGWIPNPFSPSPSDHDAASEKELSVLPDTRNWIHIEGVEVFGRSHGPVKVTAFVNGTPYIYPTIDGVEWMEAGPSMSGQNFELPPGAIDLRIKFEMERRDGLRFVSPKTDVIEPTGIPTGSRSYTLHQVSDGTRLPEVTAAVTYSIQNL